MDISRTFYKYTDVYGYDEKDNNIQYTNIPDKQREFLVSRYQDNDIILNNILNELYHGTQLVSWPIHPKLVNDFLSAKKFYVRVPDDDHIIIVPGQASRCHDNIDNLESGKMIITKHSGYALSKDGLWRSHSWGADHMGNVIETTEPRLCYVSTNSYFELCEFIDHYVNNIHNLKVKGVDTNKLQKKLNHILDNYTDYECYMDKLDKVFINYLFYDNDSIFIKELHGITLTAKYNQ